MRWRALSLVAAFAALMGVVHGCLVAAADPSGSVPADAAAAGSAPDGGDAAADRRADVENDSAVSCGDYCTVVMSRCTGDKAQYESRGQCLNMCEQLPAAGLSGEVGDSIGCRAFQANPQPASPHCTLAGAFGGEFCVSRCVAFCELTAALCNSAAGNVQPFDLTSACLSTCQCDAGPGCYDFDEDAAEYSAAARGRLNCLEYYLRKAYTTPASTTGPDAAGSDRDNCPVFLLAEGGPCSW